MVGWLVEGVCDLVLIVESKGLIVTDVVPLVR